MKTDSANTEAQTIAARAEWGIAGSYFKLLSASAAVQLELYLGGRRVLFANAATAGFYQNVDFDKIVITPTGSTAISFLAAPEEGGNDSLSSVITSPVLADNSDNAALAGAGVLVGTVARCFAFNPTTVTWDRIVTAPPNTDGYSTSQKGYVGVWNVPYVFNGASYDRVRSAALGTVLKGVPFMSEAGYAYGAGALGNTLLGALGTLGVLTSAANVNGAIVWSGEISASSAAANTWALLAKTGAVVPGSVGDGDPLLTVACLAGGLATGRIERPVFVPAGKSVWFISTAAEATISIKSAKYTLL